MAMLERSGEEHLQAASASLRLELLADIAPADHHRPRLDSAQRLDEHVRPLLPADPSDENDGRLVASKEGAEPLGVPFVGTALVVRLGRVGEIALALLDETGQGRLAQLWPELVDVDAGRNDMYPPEVLAGAEDLRDRPQDMVGAGEDRPRRRKRFPAPGAELGVPRKENSSSEP